MMRRHLWWLLAAVACGGGGDDAPSAAIVEVAPETLDPSRDDADDLTLTVEYSDGDADLGGGIARVHDCRADGVVVDLPIPLIASEEAVDEGVAIEGRLALHVSDIGWIEPEARPAPACEDLGVVAIDPDQAVFCVVLVDAADHTGDGDCSPPVAVVAEP